jgi:hypothetical protein
VGAGVCFETAVTAAGSWTVTLTSVEPYTGDAGASQGRKNYVAHGSLTAQLVGSSSGDGGSDPATLTIVF